MFLLYHPLHPDRQKRHVMNFISNSNYDLGLSVKFSKSLTIFQFELVSDMKNSIKAP